MRRACCLYDLELKQKVAIKAFQTNGGKSAGAAVMWQPGLAWGCGYEREREKGREVWRPFKLHKDHLIMKCPHLASEHVAGILVELNHIQGDVAEVGVLK